MHDAKLYLEPGSFRDKANRVFYRNGMVYRALSANALERWRKLESTTFFHRLMNEKKIIQTCLSADVFLPVATGNAWAAVLKHEPIPFVSYPYEWCFSMMKDAALLMLELLESALQENMTLQDASAFNVQFIGSQPVFIDIPSFIPWSAGQPWVGYRQFCQMFLYPLFLQAYRGVRFQPWLRGSIDGIAASDCARMLVPDLLRKGVFSHVFLHALFQSWYANSKRKAKKDIAQAGFSKEMILANIRGLQNIIRGLAWRRSPSEWTDYVQKNNYSEWDYGVKQTFVSDMLARKKRTLVWDIGCNSGDFSRLAAEKAECIVALDGDDWVIDNLYRSLHQHQNHKIVPLVMNFADASPALGWMGKERKSLMERGRPDFILCLAVIHHLAITANIPLNEFVAWLADFGAEMVIEFVTPEDDMVQTLLRNKEGNHEDYDKDVFECILAESFTIQETLELSSRKRVLYYCTPKKPGLSIK